MDSFQHNPMSNDLTKIEPRLKVQTSKNKVTLVRMQISNMMIQHHLTN